MASKIVNGNVTIHESPMFFNIRKSRVPMPRMSPTPTTAPTSTWVVEIGNPRREQIKMVVAAPNCAQKPRVGVISVMFLPIVSITFVPNRRSPQPTAAPPIKSIQNGTSTCSATDFVFNTEKIAANGPTALATSLAPCAKAT